MLWADTNIGARIDTEPGLYFSWGNTNGQTAGSGYIFDAETYADTDAAAIESNLDIEHDAARLTLGGNWRMPTTSEFQELLDNTTQRWAQKEGMNGILFQSLVNSQSIFIPVGGYWENERVRSYNIVGRLWTSEISTDNSALSAVLTSDQPYRQLRSNRTFGLPIRPVRDD